MVRGRRSASPRSWSSASGGAPSVGSSSIAIDRERPCSGSDDLRPSGRVEGGVADLPRLPGRGIDGLEAEHEGGGDGAGVGVRQLLVDADAVGLGVEDTAAHLERRADELLVVVAGVGVPLDDGDVRRRRQAERAEQVPGPGAGVGAVEHHVHVPEVIDLIRGHLGLEQYLHRRPPTRVRTPNSRRSARAVAKTTVDAPATAGAFSRRRATPTGTR